MTMVVIRVEYTSTFCFPPSVMMMPTMEMMMLYDVFVQDYIWQWWQCWWQCWWQGWYCWWQPGWDPHLPPALHLHCLLANSPILSTHGNSLSSLHFCPAQCHHFHLTQNLQRYWGCHPVFFFSFSLLSQPGDSNPWVPRSWFPDARPERHEQVPPLPLGPGPPLRYLLFPSPNCAHGGWLIKVTVTNIWGYSCVSFVPCIIQAALV